MGIDKYLDRAKDLIGDAGIPSSGKSALSGSGLPSVDGGGLLNGNMLSGLANGDVSLDSLKASVMQQLEQVAGGAMQQLMDAPKCRFFIDVAGMGDEAGWRPLGSPQ